MAKINTHTVNISDKIGADNYAANVAAMSQGTADRLDYVGVKKWHRVDRYPCFRAEWRIRNQDIVFNFYRKEGPDPMYGHDDPKQIRTNEKGHTVVAVRHGEQVALPPAFIDMLDKVAQHIYRSKGYTYTVEEIPETLSFQMTVQGAARNPLARHAFTDQFMEYLHANIPHLVPELLGKKKATGGRTSGN